MEIVLGFSIAALIAITGVGAGTITAPLLILFLNVPAPMAIGTALAYAAAVKLVIVPVQVARQQVDWRSLGVMLLAGVPGVLIGSIIFDHVARASTLTLWLYPALGLMIAFSSGWHIYRHFRPATQGLERRSRPVWLAAAMLPVGAEVGFSSSGAGALGTLALMSFSALQPARIVGTDLAFGLCLAMVGGTVHLAHGGVDLPMLLQLIAGGVLGGLAGSGIAPRIPSRVMRLALSVWLFVLGVQLCWHAFTQVRG
ncbi:MAG TPA: sulfite exporter TauE/SafE family protein [Terracidiphilus sp.]|nr:sulfite exporter TauE/SafE family protein [Terracidiphilus sp.]